MGVGMTAIPEATGIVETTALALRGGKPAGGKPSDVTDSIRDSLAKENTRREIIHEVARLIDQNLIDQMVENVEKTAGKAGFTVKVELGYDKGENLNLEFACKPSFSPNTVTLGARLVGEEKPRQLSLYGV